MATYHDPESIGASVTPEEEDRILRLLVERGLLDEESLAAGADVSTPGRLERLIARRLVDAAAVEAVDDEGAQQPDEEIPGLAGWDRYQVVRRLGQGARAWSTWRAIRGDRRVAIKFLDGGAGRGLQDARVQARLEHENVCKVYEVGQLGARPHACSSSTGDVRRGGARDDARADRRGGARRGAGAPRRPRAGAGAPRTATSSRRT